jgi:uncharacterized protein (TIGR04222 family)
MNRSLLLLSAALACNAAADERILSYHSEIRVLRDSGLAVTETIRVRAEGDRIRRGIFREFPTLYTRADGSRATAGFDVQSVRRDGADEAYRIERRVNGVAVYIGRPEHFLRPGEYTYEIRYRTDRQLGFFADHDELYWNVTGAGWAFHIDHASATVHLPPGAPPEAIRFEAYTGPQGATWRNYRAELGHGVVEFETTRTLSSHEGLTVVVSWPKGLVQPPGPLALVRYFFRDNLPLALGAIGLLGLFACYFHVWRRYGRDPAPGVIVPRYRPPDGETAASMRYLHEMKYDNRCFVSGILDLAVTGYLTIEQSAGGLFRKGNYVLHRTAGSQTPLEPEEHALLRELVAPGQSLALDDANHAVLQRATRAHEAELKRKHLNTHFRRNRGWRFIGAVLTLVVLFGGVIAAARIAGYGPEWFFLTRAGWATAGLGLVALYTNTLFGKLMPAPTVAGRKRLDEIDGFKLYLEVAEDDELKLTGAPRKTPGLYEMFLPFALALGVSQRWSERFAQIFLANPRHTPDWYHGDRWNVDDIGGFSSSLDRAFDSAVSSASSPPGESSGSSGGGGGGGSSGGGGGGGGGGGW